VVVTDLVDRGFGAGSPLLGSVDAALTELRGGVVDVAVVELLRRLGRQCTRSSRTNFPPPEGYDRWCDDAVDHLLADMFARADADNPDEGHKFILDCYARATDSPSLERLLLRAIENFLKDQARGTERGKLRRRLTGLLHSDERFFPYANDRWGLAGGSAQPWQGDLATLERAAFAVRGVDISRWNRAGPTPRSTVSALLTVTEVVLVGAGGTVSAADLARVLQTRFWMLWEEPQFVSFDENAVVSVEDPDRDGATDVALRARQVFDGLAEPERRLLPVLAESQRWGAVSGLGPAVAKVTGEALTEKVRLATVDDADRDDVVMELVRLCGSADVAG
jgi:hypothetical protein